MLDDLYLRGRLIFECDKLETPCSHARRSCYWGNNECRWFYGAPTIFWGLWKVIMIVSR